jgi:hypothetical protein
VNDDEEDEKMLADQEIEEVRFLLHLSQSLCFVHFNFRFSFLCPFFFSFC